jgi:tripeptide aminopeptidase
MDKLIEVLSVQSESYNQWRMFAYIIRQLQDIPNTSYYVSDGNIYITKGVSSDYPCMVAHMDTVHDIVEDLHPLEFNGCITGFNRVTMEQTGIGGDDKVGIYIALECLREFDDIKIAFFRDEEVGCVGSYDANVRFFDDCRFVLQCDRRGNSDFITDASGTELSSKHFQDTIYPIISSYGYKFAKGMMTDVMALKEIGVGCSVANISCGYYNPHTAQEYVDVFDVENCMEMCKTIIRYCTEIYSHKYKPRVYTPAAPYSKYAAPKKVRTLWSSDWDDYYEGSSGDAFGDYPKVDDNGNTSELCIDCWSEVPVKDNLCDACHSWYKRYDKYDKLF